MSRSNLFEEVRVKSIFHPSDFSEASEVAFVHALTIALVAGATLTVLHVEASPGIEWHDFPGVRDTLERWRLIPMGSPKSVVGRLGIKVKKVITSSNDPVKAFLDFLEQHPENLVVLAVHQREGRVRWLDKPVGELIARGKGQMTLFIPHGLEGFVSGQDGSIAPQHPHPGHEQAQAAAECGSRCAPNPQPPVACGRDYVAPTWGRWPKCLR
jgi:hypothetical protein